MAPADETELELQAEVLRNTAVWLVRERSGGFRLPPRLPYPDEVYMTMVTYLVVEKRVPKKDVQKMLGIGKDTLKKFLERAYEEDYVHTTISAPIDTVDALAGMLMAAYKPYGVSNVVVVPTWPKGGWSDGKNAEVETSSYRRFLSDIVGRAAALYVAREILSRWLAKRAEIVIGVGSGSPLLSFAGKLRLGTPKALFRPLDTGGRCGPIADTDAAGILQIILRVNDTKLVRAVCPEAPPGLIEEVKKMPEVRAVFGEDAEMPHITIACLGTVGYSLVNGPSTYVRQLAEAQRYLSRRDVMEPTEVMLPCENKDYQRAYGLLTMNQVCGSLCRYALGERGGVIEQFRDSDERGTRPQDKVIESALVHTSLAVHPNTLKKWKENGTVNVVMASSRQQSKALHAALCGGYFTTAVIDAGLADDMVLLLAGRGLRGSTLRSFF